MNLALAIVLLVAAQRLAEVIHGQRNARRLLAQGAVEAGAGHYPLLVLVHVPCRLEVTSPTCVERSGEDAARRRRAAVEPGQPLAAAAKLPSGYRTQVR